MAKVDHERQRYPACIVWTPIPCLTWLFPFIGHMGIATSEGVIRDFAGPYYVSEDNMAFGVPTKYWPLDPELGGGAASYDRAVAEASEIYKAQLRFERHPSVHKVFLNKWVEWNHDGQSMLQASSVSLDLIKSMLLCKHSRDPHLFLYLLMKVSQI